ncbi:MAG: hypothetical protein ACTSRS_14750 [Candidatus Helarchaeota archaeon]
MPHELQQKDELDPLLVRIIYNLLKSEAKYDIHTRKFTLKTKKARSILEDEMFNVHKPSFFKTLLLQMVHDALITLDAMHEKIIFNE